MNVEDLRQSDFQLRIQLDLSADRSSIALGGEVLDPAAAGDASWRHLLNPLSRLNATRFVMSGGVLRPKDCSMPDERLLANISMSGEEVVHSLAQAAEWIASADALLIGSGVP